MGFSSALAALVTAALVGVLVNEDAYDAARAAMGLGAGFPHADERVSMRAGQMRFPFALVADMDKDSRDPEGKAVWHSLLKYGELVADRDGGFAVEWTREEPLQTLFARKNRGLELSELIYWRGALWAVCDYTGVVYEIKNGKAFLRHVLADGDGDKEKAFKAEWATLKDDVLYVGSLGKEWVEDDKILHHNMAWVKTIDTAGRVRSQDWEPVYTRLREAANATYPGYLSHEAVHWDPETRQWLVLPRRASQTTPYSEAQDEVQGANVLLIATEMFGDITAVKIGQELDPTWGFSSVRTVPGTDGQILMALSVYEVDGVTKTRLVLFSVEGEYLLVEQVSDTTKFEGLEFL